MLAAGGWPISDFGGEETAGGLMPSFKSEVAAKIAKDANRGTEFSLPTFASSASFAVTTFPSGDR